MKRLFLLVAVSLVALCSSIATTKAQAPERQGWDEDFSLYGNVESVTITQYELQDKFGEVIRGDVEDKNKYCFNNVGDVIEYAYYNSDGSLYSKYISKYDSSGNKIEYARYNSDGSLNWKYIYKYDSSRNIIEVTGYKSDALIPMNQTEVKIVYRNE